MAASQVLLWAQLRGNSQGVIKIPALAVHRSDRAGRWTADLDTHISAHIDGQQNYGMVVLHEATAVAIQKAKTASVGFVGVSNVSSSTGAIGYDCACPCTSPFIGLLGMTDGFLAGRALPSMMLMHAFYNPT